MHCIDDRKSSAMTQLTGFDLNYSMLDAYINLDKLEPSLRREMYADLRDGSQEELKKLRPGSCFDVV